MAGIRKWKAQGLANKSHDAANCQAYRNSMETRKFCLKLNTHAFVLISDSECDTGAGVGDW